MSKKSKILLMLTFVTSSLCSLLYGEVVVSSPDPVVDFLIDGNHMAIMYGYNPANKTAKRIDVYNTSSNSITTIANNILIVYSPYLSAQPSTPVSRIKSSIGRNTGASYEYFL